MKNLSVLGAATFLLSTQAALAAPYETRIADMVGTTFIITVDWDLQAVSAKLVENPTGLSGADLEARMQMATSFGTSVECSMLETGRVHTAENVVSGDLSCPWFDQPVVQPDVVLASN